LAVSSAALEVMAKAVPVRTFFYKLIKARFVRGYVSKRLSGDNEKEGKMKER
jgi:hypothetical protein